VTDNKDGSDAAACRILDVEKYCMVYNILVVHSFILQNASSNPPGLFLSGMSKEFINEIEVV
jgi:hypothetical protein